MNKQSSLDHRLTLAELLDLMLADGMVLPDDAAELRAERKLHGDRTHPLVVVADQKWRNPKLPARVLNLEVLTEWLAGQVGAGHGD